MAQQMIAAAAVSGETAQVVGHIPLGDRVGMVSILSPDGKRLYVINAAPSSEGSLTDYSVTTIDTKTNKVVSGPAPVGNVFPQTGVSAPTVAMTPDGKQIYMVQAPSETAVGTQLLVYNTATNSAGAPIELGANPASLAVSPDGRRVYVANGNSTISVIDTASNTVVGTPIAVGGAAAPNLAVSTDSRYVYATILRVSPYTGQIEGAVQVFDSMNSYAPVGDPIDLSHEGSPSYPLSITAAPGGGRLYVKTMVYPSGILAQPRPAISVIDTASRTVVGAPIEFDSDGFVTSAIYSQMAISPDGKRLYVTAVDGDASDQNAATTTITTIDTNTLAPVGAPITLDGIALALLISADGRRLYAPRNYVNFASPNDSWVKIAMIDTASQTVRDVTVPDAVVAYGGHALSADGSRLYLNVGEFDSDSYGYVTVINTGASVSPSAPGAAARAAAELARQQAATQAAVLREQARAAAEAARQAAEARAAAQRAEAEAQAAWLRKPNVVQNASALYTHLRKITGSDADGIVIEKVQAQRGGQERFIVYLGGTTHDLFQGNQPIAGNVPAYHGEVKPHQLAAIRRALGSNTSAEVMLVGYSQGGLDAQNIAALGEFNVTTVVTYGAPINHSAPTGYRIIHLHADLDPIPGLSKADFYDDHALAGNIFKRRAANTNFWSLLTDPWGDKLHGDLRTYESVGSQFWSNPGYSAVKANMRTFLQGKVIGTYN